MMGFACAGERLLLVAFLLGPADCRSASVAQAEAKAALAPDLLWFASRAPQLRAKICVPPCLKIEESHFWPRGPFV
jgi:hypothetical protein